MIAATISWLHATINRVGREFNEVKNKFKKSHVFDDYDDKKIQKPGPSPDHARFKPPSDYLFKKTPKLKTNMCKHLPLRSICRSRYRNLTIMRSSNMRKKCQLFYRETNDKVDEFERKLKQMKIHIYWKC